jgi:hypothetical protein
VADAIHISLRTADSDAAERLVREYALDAVDRLTDRPDCVHATFSFDGEPDVADRNVIVLVYVGDVEAFVADERERWEALEAEGRIEGWERALTAEDVDPGAGEEGETSLRIGRLATRCSRLAYETFEEFPAAVDTFPEGDTPGPVGWWGLLHTMTVQANYSLEEELAAYEYGIEHTLRNVAQHRGPEAADALVDDLLDSIESAREDVKEGRLDS